MLNYFRNTMVGRYILYLVTLGTIALSVQSTQENPEIKIGRYTVRKSQIDSLKLLQGMADDNIWVGLSDDKNSSYIIDSSGKKVRYILNIFADTSKITPSLSLIDDIDVDPKDNVVSGEELKTKFDAEIERGLNRKY